MAQFNKEERSYIDRNNDLFEVNMISNKDGIIYDEQNPFPVSLGSENITITGNVNVGTSVEISNDIGNPIPTIQVPGEVNGFTTFNNFGLNAHKGFSISDVEIPVFAIRVKPNSGKKFYLIDYKIINNSSDSSIVGYQWYNFDTVSGPAWSWVDINTTGVQYAIFKDNISGPNSFTHSNPLHSGTVVGKTSTGLTLSMSQIPFTDGGMNLILAARRLESSAALDFWFNVTCQL